MTKSNRKSKRRIKTRRQQREQKNMSMVMMIGGFVIIAIVIISASGQSVTSNFSYQPEDIMYDYPLHAIHEMAPSTLANINFLPKDGPQPKIVVSETSYNFGSIGPTEVVTHEFIITNQGDAPLTISRAYTTCGCTTADFTSTVIPPGKVVVMTIVLDTGFHDVSGQTVRRGVIIENNDPKNPQLEIWIQASVLKSP